MQSFLRPVRCFDGEAGTSVTAHELGHAFGLEHDFRDDTYIMSYGAAPNRLSQCAAGWLDASRFFNTDQTAFNEPTTIQMLTPASYPPNAENLTLRFEVTDVDSIHQVQLIVPTTTEDPASGVKLHSCSEGHAQSNTVEFDTPTLTAYAVNTIALQVIDGHGNITRQEYTLRADDTLIIQNPMDVNSDGVVNIRDLVLVASNFGQTGQNSADVNSDGVVNVSDLVLVASALGEGTAAAPILYPSDSRRTHRIRHATDTNASAPNSTHRSDVSAAVLRYWSNCLRAYCRKKQCFCLTIRTRLTQRHGSRINSLRQQM